ncbi:MAG: dihydroxy-acid dehydratase, partial [Planctomycetia bacterium]
LAEQLAWWEKSERRERFRAILRSADGVDPDDVIMPPAAAAARGSIAVAFTIAPSLAIDPRRNAIVPLSPRAAAAAGGMITSSGSTPSADRRMARVFTSERAAIAAIKQGSIREGDVLVLAGIGPMGTGMEETYQVTGALKQLPIASRVAVITDARFSGVSTGACIGHVSPEALAGGPSGTLVEGDMIAITIDTRAAVGSVELVAHAATAFTPAEASAELAGRPSRPDLAPDPRLPTDTRIWSLLQEASGGVWAGCVYDEPRLAARLRRLDVRDERSGND